MALVREREKAIALRRQGLSYNEVLKEIPVAKSTLSLWLRSVGLSKRQKQRLTEKKLASIKRAGLAKKQQRIDLVNKIREETSHDVTSLSKKDLWLSGIMLYWAEGGKIKDYRVSEQVRFSNSDPRMAKLFMRWLKEILAVPDNDIKFEIYIHQTGNIPKALEYWANNMSCQKEKIKVYLKSNTPKKTNRKNIGENYYGLLRVIVKRSTNLNRKIAAWTEHICKYWEVD